MVCIFLPCCSFPPHFYLPRLIFMFKDKTAVRVSEVAGKVCSFPLIAPFFPLLYTHVLENLCKFCKNI